MKPDRSAVHSRVFSISSAPVHQVQPPRVAQVLRALRQLVAVFEAAAAAEE